MGKGFGIAALVLSILSMFSPYGVNFAVIWVAMICAIVGALNADRGLTIAAVVIAAAGILLFAPLTLAAVLNAAAHGDYAGLVFAFLPIAAAVVAIIVDVARRSGEAPPANPQSGGDMRSMGTGA